MKRLIRKTIARMTNWTVTEQQQYWNQRARDYGARAVVNLAHPPETLEAVTLGQWSVLSGLLSPLLRGGEKNVLDFGCGSGRFSGRLADLTGAPVMAVDPTAELVRLAPQHPAVKYCVIKSPRIPAPDHSIDVLWICLVLGGISESKLAPIGAELRRVLLPDGLVFLVENTDERVNAKHWKGRDIAFYRKVFQFVDLKHLHDYSDQGERISVLAGRSIR